MTLIIGKRSNLSSELFRRIPNCVLISTSDVENNLDMIEKYCKEDTVNIIFNNFQASTHLNDCTNFEMYITKSILNTSRLLTFFLEKKIKLNKIIYTSSSSVYGNNKFCTESDQVKPMNLQGSLKVANEELIKSFCITYNINYTIVRLFNMFGGSDSFSIISKIKDAYLNDKVLTTINNGTAIRDYVYVGDVANVYKILINEINIPNILNIASGNGKRVVDILQNLENNGVILKLNNIMKDEISASIADITELAKIINIDDFIEVKSYLLNECK